MKILVNNKEKVVYEISHKSDYVYTVLAILISLYLTYQLIVLSLFTVKSLIVPLIILSGGLIFLARHYTIKGILTIPEEKFYLRAQGPAIKEGWELNTDDITGVTLYDQFHILGKYRFRSYNIVLEHKRGQLNIYRKDIFPKYAFFITDKNHYKLASALAEKLGVEMKVESEFKFIA